MKNTAEGPITLTPSEWSKSKWLCKRPLEGKVLEISEALAKYFLNNVSEGQ